MFLFRNVFQVFEKLNVEIADNTTLQHGQLSSNIERIFPQTGRFVLENRPYSKDSDYSKKKLENNIKDLTKILTSNHSEGILNVVEYVNNIKTECFNIVFTILENVKFQGTLQSILRNTTQVSSLEMRLSICTQLAESVLHVHCLDLVHKNISSMNIMMMKIYERIFWESNTYWALCFSAELTLCTKD